MKKIFTSSHLMVFIRILFGIVFIFSGLMKLTDISAFAEALDKFKMFTETTLLIAKFSIPIAEIVFGFMIAANIKTVLSSQVITFMLALFTAVIVSKVFEGEELSCGCFGNLSSGRIDNTTIIRNIVLMSLGISVTTYYDGSSNKSNVTLKRSLINTIVLTLIFFLIVQTYIFALQNRELKNRITFLMNDQEVLKEGEQIKPFEAREINDNKIEIDFDSTRFQKTIIYLMSVKCEPCKMNTPNWVGLTDRLKKENVRIFAVAMDSVGNILDYIKDKKLNYNIYSNPTLEFKNAIKGYVTPQTILIDNKGRVINVWTGILNQIKVAQILSLTGYKSE